MGSVTTASAGCATSFTFCDEVEDFSFFSSFTFDFLLFGRSYSGTERGKKKDDTDQYTFQIVARCTQQSAPLLMDWKSAQTQDTQPQNAPHCHQNPVLKFSAGIPTLTSFSFPAVLAVLFLSSLSLPPTDLLSSFLLVILSSFPPFIGCFTSATKEFQLTQSNIFTSRQTSLLHLRTVSILFLPHILLFLINLSCTALKNNDLEEYFV